MALVSRDPFARVELHRESVSLRDATWEGLSGASPGCAWCGGVNGHGALYRYGVESDGGRVSRDDRAFCSRECRRFYYGS